MAILYNFCISIEIQVWLLNGSIGMVSLWLILDSLPGATVPIYQGLGLLLSGLFYIPELIVELSQIEVRW